MKTLTSHQCVQIAGGSDDRSLGEKLKDFTDDTADKVKAETTRITDKVHHKLHKHDKHYVVYPDNTVEVYPAEEE